MISHIEWNCGKNAVQVQIWHLVVMSFFEYIFHLTRVLFNTQIIVILLKSVYFVNQTSRNLTNVPPSSTELNSLLTDQIFYKFNPQFLSMKNLVFLILFHVPMSIDVILIENLYHFVMIFVPPEVESYQWIIFESVNNLTLNRQESFVQVLSSIFLERSIVLTRSKITMGVVLWCLWKLFLGLRERKFFLKF